MSVFSTSDLDATTECVYSFTDTKVMYSGPEFYPGVLGSFARAKVHFSLQPQAAPEKTKGKGLSAGWPLISIFAHRATHLQLGRALLTGWCKQPRS